jgi:hypothetical protein
VPYAHVLERRWTDLTGGVEAASEIIGAATDELELGPLVAPYGDEAFGLPPTVGPVCLW